MTAIIPAHSASLTNQPLTSYHDTFTLLLASLSPNSRRVYAHTYKLWQAFCEARGIDYDEFSGRNVFEFLSQEGVSKSTRQQRLIHMRRLGQAFYAADTSNPRYETFFAQLGMLKITEGDKSKARQRKALSRKQVDTVFDVWSEDTLIHKRNRAILAVIFYAGLRRSEAVALTWDDVDLEERLITVQHGKGDKKRVSALFGEDALNALIDWKNALEAAAQDRKYVFPEIRKGGILAADKPMSTTGLYKIVKQTGEKAGGIDFSPHDARRTLITAALNTGTPVHIVQRQAGHARAETTLLYAQVKDAKEVRDALKLNY